jgi:drug/metabolite transporter (DMT)-like permease
MALSAVLLTSMYLVIIRGVNRSRKVGHEREIDFVPCLVVAAILVSVVALSAGADLRSVRNMDIVFLILQGVVVLSIGSALLTTATAYVSAPEVSLFMLVDVVLEPMWVWLAGFDTPPYYTIYCGAVVISALLINSILAWYEEKDLAVKVASGEDEVSPLLVPNGGTGTKKI